MKEVFKNLWVGSKNDVVTGNDWAIIHACKEPYHRQFVGYTGRGAPKDGPEYLFAERGNELALNIVDAKQADFFDKTMINKALNFIERKLGEGFKVLVHCNQGESRGPSIALLYLASKGLLLTGVTFERFEVQFKSIYPSYNPGAGIREFIQQHWNEYMGK